MPPGPPPSPAPHLAVGLSGAAAAGVVAGILLPLGLLWFLVYRHPHCCRRWLANPCGSSEASLPLARRSAREQSQAQLEVKLASPNLSRPASASVSRVSSVNGGPYAASEQSVLANSFAREYVRVQLLGRGGSGTAYLMKRQRDGDLCVVKHVSLALIESTRKEISVRAGGDAGGGGGGSGVQGSSERQSSPLEQPLTEVAILASLEHPHIIRYLASACTVDELHIWMEYAPGGSLDRAIQTQTRAKVGFSSGRVCTWAIQLADALEHMHSRHVLHRDLKAANVFLTHAGDVKLG